MESTSDEERPALRKQGTVVQRAGTALQRAGSNLQRAGSNLGLQRASTLPTEDRELRHAATMPMTFDMESDRPCCCGLWKLQQMVGFVLGVSSLVFLSALRPVETYPNANEMLGITFLVGFFWVFEVIPIYITALLPLVLLPFFRITTTQNTAQAYWNQIQMLVVATYLVDIALEEVHLPRRAALKLLLTTGVVQPALLMAVFMVLCFVLSMICNSIAVTLMVTPFAISLMNAAEESARDAAAANHSSTSSDEESDTNEAQDGVTKEVQRFSDGLMLAIAYSSTCGGMAMLTSSISNEELITVPRIDGHVTYRLWAEYAIPVALVTLVIAYFTLYLRYVRGLKLKTMTHEVLEYEYEELCKEIGPLSRDEVAVGILQVLQFVLLFLSPIIGEYVKTGYGEKLLGDSTFAAFPAALLFFIPSSVRPGQSLLSWPAVHDKFDFGLLLLIGGGFAISRGFMDSGLNIALGQVISKLCEANLGAVPNLTLIVLCTLSTQIFSTVTTASTLLPALNAAAANILINPLQLLLPATIACSFAFMLPTATPANVIVLAKSQDLARPLRVRDFVFAGAPLTIIAVLVGAWLTHVMEGAVFDDAGGAFPQWAVDQYTTVWLSVPGMVEGEMVESQACRITDSMNMSACALKNGTILSPFSDYSVPMLPEA